MTFSPFKYDHERTAKPPKLTEKRETKPTVRERPGPIALEERKVHVTDRHEPGTPT